MKSLLVVFLSFSACFLKAQPQDSLRYYELVTTGDTLQFRDAYGGEDRTETNYFRNRVMKVEDLMSEYQLIDSLPEHNMYLYSNGFVGNDQLTSFWVSRQKDDTARVSGFSTQWPAAFQKFRLVQEGENPIVELQYIVQNQEEGGSTEIEISAFFVVNRYGIPAARVVRKLWESRHGNYDPSCKDYQFYSIEFSRDIQVRKGQLHLKNGTYKYSSNLNCQLSNQRYQLPGGVFVMEDGLVLRKEE